MSTLIKNIRFAGDTHPDGWVLVCGEMIQAVGRGSEHMPEANTVVDGQGALALPGVIDCHVHFREPGLTEKADIASESAAAVCGGVTSYFEMPNTKPATTSIKTWEDKMALAAEKSLANYAFFIGATNDNITELALADYSRVPGVKLFMGSSTGNMLVDDATAISDLFRNVDTVMAVHAEDQSVIEANVKAAVEKYGGMEFVPLAAHSLIRSSEACYRSTALAVELAKKYMRRLHVCHISTARELELLTPGDPAGKLITSEVSPHHLMWCADDYASKGTRIKMNPAVKTAADRDALRRALEDGLIDMVATDHAPHQLKDKQGGALSAASGAPLVQFSLVWMLDNFSETLVRRVMCENPAKVYGIDRRGALASGYYADIVLVKESEPYTVADTDVVSKCGWTPMQGVTLKHRVQSTWVNGQCVYSQGEVMAQSKAAAPIRFVKP